MTSQKKKNSSLCPDCGNRYISVGDHIGKSDCCWPDLTKKQKSIIEGCLLGDGYLRKNGSFEIESIQRDFIHWLEKQLNPFTQHAKLYRTKKENKEQSLRDSNPIQTTDDIDNYNATYRYLSKVHHDIKKLRSKWYHSSGKNIPNTFELTPLSAKMWYVGDGTVNKKRTRQIFIYTRQTDECVEKQIQLLESKGFGVYRVKSNHAIYFEADSTVDFLEWVNKPVPGFEYKWRYKK